ncbi:heavy-metal-associated domain-containing protein [Azospirillum sp. sgz302134]
MQTHTQGPVQTLKVTGMTCGSCAQAVTKAVEALPAVERALVDLDTGEVTVEGNADQSTVKRAIEEAGYHVTETA